MNPHRSPTLSAPYVARDGLSRPLRHPVTGKMVDSKAEFRKMTADAGCVEIGDADMSASRPQAAAPVEQSVAEAVEKLRQGYKPAPITADEWDG